MQETWVQSLGWEDTLEKEKATHSSILAWRIPWTEEPGGLQPMGSQRVRHDRNDLARTHAQYFTHNLMEIPENQKIFRIHLKVKADLN